MRYKTPYSVFPKFPSCSAPRGGSIGNWQVLSAQELWLRSVLVPSLEREVQSSQVQEEKFIKARFVYLLLVQKPLSISHLFYKERIALMI